MTVAPGAPTPTGGSTAPVVPPPPPGPGVQPPFVAPPTDGTKQRRWWAVGLAAGTVILVCIGGLVGLGALVVLGTQAVQERAVGAVEDYLTALRDGDYDAAYGQLCPPIKEDLSRNEFVRSQEAGPRIQSFTIGEFEAVEELLVSATIRYANDTVETTQFVLDQDTETGAIQVCGERD
jgi:hypothetical protein